MINEIPFWIPVCFFLIALFYSMAGFGGGSSYLAVLALAGLPYQSIPSASLACNLIVTTGRCWHFCRAGYFKFKNVNFLACDNTLDFSEKNEVILYDEQCGSNIKSVHLTIPRLKDGGESYKIYNDSICKGMNLKRYPASLSIEDFAIEKMQTNKFCETFITSL